MQKKISVYVLLGLMIFIPSLFYGVQDSTIDQRINSSVPYESTFWTQSLGNQRAVVKVDKLNSAVRVTLPWRRRDDNPEEIGIRVTSSCGIKVANAYGSNFTRSKGDVIFQPTAGLGNYYIYYLPIKPQPRWGWTVTYFPTTRYEEACNAENCSKSWLSRNDIPEEEEKLTTAKLIRFESRSDFDRPDPMELIITAEEKAAFIKNYGNDEFILIPEDRKFSIRMTEDIPYRWISSPLTPTFKGQALKNEYYPFQIGLYAQQELNEIHVESSNLSQTKNTSIIIPSTNITCFNLEGVDASGNYFKKQVNVKADRVQAFWFGIDIPRDTEAGLYKGQIKFKSKDSKTKTIDIQIQVNDEIIEDRGDSDLWRLSRLRWLNSKIGINDELIKPYTAIKWNESKLSILGRSISFNQSGLPTNINSQISMYRIKEKGKEILGKPASLELISGDKTLNYKGAGIQELYQSPGRIELQADSTADQFTLRTDISAEADGYLRYRFTIRATADLDLSDIRFNIPVDRNHVKWFKPPNKGGVDFMGVTTGSHPMPIPEQWSGTIGGGLKFNIAWLGDYDGGIAFKPKNDLDEWNNDRLTADTLPVAQAWDNNGKGKYTIDSTEETHTLSAHTGQYNLKKGDEIRLNFALFVTPFKPMTRDHWNYRYYHEKLGRTPKLSRTKGAKIINLHHGGRINPWINYPVMKIDDVKELTTQAHEMGKKLKLYYTVRELTVRAPEIWALRSLGHEILLSGDGYREFQDKDFEYQNTHHLNRPGAAWLAEHMVSDYRMRWHQPIEYSKELQDMSIGIEGLSRWNNFYLEGLSWMSGVLGTDGIYLDDIGYDRSIMKRVRRSMDNAREGCLIDYHGSAFEGFEHMPYINSLWFGEGADYTQGPLYWMVEVSGIPFGMSGEILSHKNMAHKGLIFGIVKRMRWCGNPGGIWDWYDQFGIEDADFQGFWRETAPVKSRDELVPATAYIKKGEKTAIVIANWDKTVRTVKLDVDWESLGLNSHSVKIRKPRIKGVQSSGNYSSLDSITVAAGKGIVLEISAK